jgi:hypothetical protein
MGENYFKGLFRTLMIERFMDGAISENQVDGIKECIIRFCESKIDDLPLSDQEKEELKHQMKQSADAYNHGIKDGLRMVGRFA